MNVLMISPGYPAEMQRFTRGLAEVGAKVIGFGDQPQSVLDHEVKSSLSAYFQAESLWDESTSVAQVRRINDQIPIHRVECLWEPGMGLAAALREALGLPGLTVAQTVPFRDKETMKQVLDHAGIRTPHHYRVKTSDEARQAVQKIGYPVIVKPIAGAGATDTYRVDSDEELDHAIAAVRHVDEVSVEEFVEGEEFTFDTICSGGTVHYFNMMWYRPRPLEGKLKEWISPQAIALRDVDDPKLAAGREMGFKVLDALQFQTGFTHMEWYLKDDGEAVFGEIGGRPPGANAVELMNYACDIDVFRGWAEAVVHGRFTQTVDRRFNCGIVFKRAQGQGRIRRVDGLEGILDRFGPHIARVDLLPVGAPRRDWKQVQISDGFIIVRHPDLQETIGMTDAIGTDLTLYAG
jgi:hypothetical protein